MWITSSAAASREYSLTYMYMVQCKIKCSLTSPFIITKCFIEDMVHICTYFSELYLSFTTQITTEALPLRVKIEKFQSTSFFMYMYMQRYMYQKIFVSYSCIQVKYLAKIKCSQLEDLYKKHGIKQYSAC